MATDGGDDRWRNVLEARSITVRPVDGDPVDLQEHLDGLGGGDVTVTWADVTGKPATYPPATHTHTAADVGAAPASHTHPAAQVTGLATVATSGAYGDLSGQPSIPSTPGDVGAAPASHTHAAAQVSDASAVGRSVLTAADGAAARSAIGAGTSSLAIGTTASTAAAGNHTHTAYATTAALSDLAARVQALEDAAAGA